MNLQGEPLTVGRLVHARALEVTPEVVRFYADTFGDHHTAYAQGTAAPPLLFHSEVYTHVPRWYLRRIVGNLHARQEWQLYAPLRSGTRVATRSTVVERYRKRDRDYVVNEVDYADAADGRLLVRGRTHQSFLADEPSPAAGFVVDRASAEKKERRAPAGEGAGPELEPVELLVDRTVCWRFSGPTKNYHTDPDEARKLGFPDIVVQGMLSTCLVSQLVGNAFGAGWFAGGRMDVRLVNVLWANERIRARGRVREDVPEGTARRRHLDVWVEKDDPQRTVVTVGTASALL